MSNPPTIVRIRIWLSDRPGALGAVASRIGGVGGDVVGIEILERGGGRAVDDLVVSIPDKSLIKLLVSEIQEVDGVDVEDVVPVGDAAVEPDMVLLESIPELIALTDRAVLLAGLADCITAAVEAHWTAIVDLDRPGDSGVVVRTGQAPAAEWMIAFAHGSTTSELVSSGQRGPDDIVPAPMTASGLVLLVGREGHAFRDLERRRCVAMAQIVDTRLRQLNRPQPS